MGRPLSEHTGAERAKEGKWPGMKLRMTGDLAGGIASDRPATSAVAGTDLVYAPTHPVGAEEGVRFGWARAAHPLREHPRAAVPRAEKVLSTG